MASLRLRAPSASASSSVTSMPSGGSENMVTSSAASYVRVRIESLMSGWEVLFFDLEAAFFEFAFFDAGVGVEVEVDGAFEVVPLPFLLRPLPAAPDWPLRPAPPEGDVARAELLALPWPGLVLAVSPRAFPAPGSSSDPASCFCSSARSRALRSSRSCRLCPLVLPDRSSTSPSS